MNTEEFKIPTVDDIYQLSQYFEDCEWIDDYIEDIKSGDSGNYRILTINGEIIGIACFWYTGDNISGIPLYYVSTRCTKDKGKHPTREIGLRTPGRLLWAYILREIYIQIYSYSGGRFIVYNHAIDQAKGYHIKMGMESASNIDFYGLPLINVVQRAFISNPDLNTAELPIQNGIITELDETYLFYVSKEINYSSIDTILLYLPPSRRGGYKKKTNKKKKKTKKNKSLQIKKR